jgi:hypothetical protein
MLVAWGWMLIYDGQYNIVYKDFAIGAIIHWMPPTLATDCFKKNFDSWAVRNGAVQLGLFTYYKATSTIVKLVAAVVTCECRVWAVPEAFDVIGEGSCLMWACNKPDLVIEVCISLDETSQAVFHTCIRGAKWVQHATAELAMEACVLMHRRPMERLCLLGQYDDSVQALSACIAEDWSGVDGEVNKVEKISNNTIRLTLKRIDDGKTKYNFIFQWKKANGHPFCFDFSGSATTYRLKEGTQDEWGMSDIEVFSSTRVTDVDTARTFYHKYRALLVEPVEESEPSLKRRRHQNNANSANQDRP